MSTATSLAAIYEPLQTARAEFVDLVTRRDTLSAQAEELRKVVAAKSAGARADDEEAVRFLTDVRVRLDLIERDLAGIKQALPEVAQTLKAAHRKTVREGQAARAAEEASIGDVLNRALQEARKPYSGRLAALSQFDFALRDLDYMPDNERELLNKSAALLEAFAGVEKGVSPPKA